LANFSHVAGTLAAEEYMIQQRGAAALVLPLVWALTLGVPAFALGSSENSPPTVAFLSDVHFHDVYGTFEDGSFPGLPGRDGKKATIRTMMAQLTSTRLFNENYFAFLAALDELAAKKVKLVVLSGDFSDDGQPVHMRGFTKILAEYQKKYGMEFITTFGNHDPVRPYTKGDGEPDFLGEGGFPQRVYSRGGAPETKDYQGPWASIPVAGNPLPTIATEEIRSLGYKELMEFMAPYGVMPQARYVYWETPYSTYNEKTYTFEKAQAEAGYERRQFDQGEPGKTVRVPDGTYLVEPVPGVWFASVDANVYLPSANGEFSGSGDAGWNRMVTHKPHVVAWLRSVVDRARASGKKLVTFSHYPMVEFYKGTNDDVAAIFGAAGLDLKRRPTDATTQAAAATGVQLHFAGHLHTNDTGVFRQDGRFLVNVQIPSLAAYVPAYKVLTFRDESKVDIDTVVLKDVKNFNALFDRYEVEHRTLVDSKASAVWNHDVLASKDYREFNNWHIRELTRLRFLVQNWPTEMRTLVNGLSQADLVTLAFLESDATLAQVQGLGDLPSALKVAALATVAPSSAPPAPFDRTVLLASWDQARTRAVAALQAEGLSLEALANQPALELVIDFHRMLNAGELAQPDVAPRAGLHRVLAAALVGRGPAPVSIDKKLSADSALTSVVQHRFRPVFDAIAKNASAPPNVAFTVDFAQQAVTRR